MFRRVIGFAAAFVVSGAAPALAQAPAVDPVQEQFVQAMQALEAGRVGEATTILSILAAQTHAPRIRLELARALYFEGRFKESREQFLRVYRMPDLPYAVRRTVNTFLSDIDQRAGYFQPSIGLAVDSNPLQAAPSGVYDIFGIPFDYITPAETQTGVRLEANGALPLGDGGISAIGGASVTQFADREMAQYTASAGLRRLDSARRGYWGLGTTYYERKGTAPVTNTYLERVRRVTLPDRSKQVLVRLAVNYLDVRDQTQLAGWGLEGGVDYGFDLSPNTAVNVSASGGSSGAKYAIDRRVYGAVSGAVILGLPEWNKTASLRASVGDSRYGDIDPFFGKRRDDVTTSLDARLIDGHPRFGLFPSVSVNWSRRNSSIRFFSYEQTGFNVGLQRRF